MKVRKQISLCCWFALTCLTVAGVARAQTIPQGGWTLVSVDSQETTAEDGAATNAFDGDVETHWVTGWSDGSPGHPHELVVDLGQNYDIDGFRYVPRKDPYSNGRVAGYEFSSRLDVNDWNGPAAAGTFAADQSTKQVDFAPRVGRFVRFRATSEISGNPWTVVSELEVLGAPFSGNLPPNGQIAQPGGAPVILVGESLSFVAGGTDPEGDLPLGFVWQFGDPAIPDSTLAVTGPVTFDNPGSWTVHLTATDALGAEDPTPATMLVTVLDPGADPTIPQAGWSLVSVDSQEQSGENGAATNAFDGDPSTNWVTGWSSGSAPIPHQITIDLGQVYQVEGFRYLPRADPFVNGRIAGYEFYVSQDAGDLGASLAAGVFGAGDAENEIALGPVAGRYVRLRATSEINGNPWTVVAELNVLGRLFSGNLPPDGTIDTPDSDVVILAGGAVDFSGSGTDQDDDLPLTYLWEFGDPGIADATVAAPGSVTFDDPGTFEVRFTVTDAEGVADPTPATRTIEVLDPDADGPIPRGGWSVEFVDSEETAGENGAAENVFDGDPATNWVTGWSAGNAPLPHEIVIDLGQVYELSALRYLPRQGSPNGRIAQYELYVSEDTQRWGAPRTTGVFPNAGAEQEVGFDPVPGRYVRLRALSEVNGNPWTVVAELNLVGGPFSGNFPPQGTIDTPEKDVTILAGESVEFAGSGTDQEGDLPLTYAWDFGDPAIPGSAAAAPGSIVFAEPGTFLVTFTVTDSTGHADPTPATRMVTVLDPDDTLVIPQTDWTLHYVDSQETVGEDGAATNAFDGDPATYWTSAWSGGPPPHPHEIQIDLNGLYDIEGFRYLPRQINTNGRVGEYEFFVSLDGTNWGLPQHLGVYDRTREEKEARFAVRTARYVRFVALSEIFDNPWTAVAEINVLGSAFDGNFAPGAEILFPAADVTISTGRSVDFEGTGDDPEGQSPISYAWDFGDPAIPPSAAANPSAVVYSSPGTFVVTLTTTDAQGKPTQQPARRIVRVLDPGQNGEVDPSGWSVLYVDSELPAEPATNAFDGNPFTSWRTAAVPGRHEIRIDLGSAYEHDGFAYVPPPIGTGRVGGWQYFISEDGVDWGQPVAMGAFADSAAPKKVLFVPKTGRFVRFRALDEVDGGAAIEIAELEVLGRCTVPYVKILDPVDFDVVAGPNVTVRASVCLNAADHEDWGVVFLHDLAFAGGDGIAVTEPPWEATFEGLGPAERTFEALIVNDSGVPVTGERTVDSVAPVGIGDSWVAIGDSITNGFGDDLAFDDVSSDGRVSGGGYLPVLNDLLTTDRGVPQKIAQEGVNGITSAGGLERLPGVIDAHPKAQFYLLLYGTNDAGVPVPAGLGLSPGNPGYAGSFKANMQAMIEMLVAAGKMPFLAHVPKPLVGGASIPLYNLVVDELVLQNGLAPPADFYAHFEAHPEEMGDALHPNGEGYRSMAELWLAVVPSAAAAAN
ncbi:MAG: PKD domain-containing protein [bacterium]|nr:PKD domain-containing protein [bacterium]